MPFRDPFRPSSPQPTTPNSTFRDPFRGTGSPPTSPQASQEPITMSPSDWDWRSANVRKGPGPNGEALPEGAVGWQPDGKPYFGSGFDGWWRGKIYTARAAAAPTKEEWRSALSKIGDIFNEDSSESEDPLGALGKGSIDLLSGVGEALELTGRWMDSTGKGSILNPLLRGTKIALSGLFDALQLAAIGVERVGGTIGLMGAKYIWGNEDWTLNEAWQASRMAYTFIVNPVKREEFLERLRDGEDPYLLAQELQNPWAEMVGQVIGDPLNAPDLQKLLTPFARGAHNARVLQNMENYARLLDAPATAKLARAFDNAGEIITAEIGAGRFQEFSDAAYDAYRAVETGQKQKYTFAARAATSNQEVMLRNASNVMGLIVGRVMQNGGSPEEVARMVRAMARAASSNKEEAVMGLVELLHFKNPRATLSTPFMETAILMRRLLVDSKGKYHGGKLAAIIKEAKKTPSSLAERLFSLVEDATKSLYPTVSDMEDAAKRVAAAAKTGKKISDRDAKLAEAYENVSEGIKWFSRIERKTASVKGKINTVLGAVYFSQPGIAARNALQDTLAIMTDIGPKAYRRSVKHAEEYLRGWLGFHPSSASGFKTSMKTSEVAGESERIMNQIQAVLTLGLSKKVNLMQGAEVASSTRLMAGAYEDAITKTLAEMPLDELRDLGFTDKDIHAFRGLIAANYGDVRAAVRDLGKLTKGGMIDEWRLLDYVSPEIERHLKKLDLYEDFINLTRNPDITPAEIRQWFDNAIGELDSKAIHAENAFTGVSELHRDVYDTSLEMKRVAADVFDGDEDAAFDELAHIDEFLETSSQAEDAFAEALDGHFSRLAFALDKSNPDHQKIFTKLEELKAEYRKLRQGLREETLRNVTDLKDTAWDITHQINDRHFDSSYNNMRRLWNSAGLPGEMPLELTKLELRDLVWKTLRPRWAAEWENYFSGGFAGAETLIKYMRRAAGRVGLDLSDLGKKYDYARQISAQANRLRTAINSGGKSYDDFVSGLAYIMRSEADIGSSPRTILVKLCREGRIAPSPWTNEAAKTDSALVKMLNEYTDRPFANIDDAANRLDDVVDSIVQRSVAEGRIISADSLEVRPIATIANTPQTSKQFQKITELYNAKLAKKQEEIDELMSTIDSLKHCPRTGIKLAGHYMKDIEKAKMVTFIDLRGAKWMNDHAGHDAGDMLIYALAEELRKLNVPGAEVYRRYSNGDEFIVTFAEYDKAIADATMMRLQDAFAQSRIPVKTAKEEHKIYEGFSIWTGTANTIADADKALNAGKSKYISDLVKSRFTDGDLGKIADILKRKPDDARGLLESAVRAEKPTGVTEVAETATRRTRGAGSGSVSPGVGGVSTLGRTLDEPAVRASRLAVQKFRGTPNKLDSRTISFLSDDGKDVIANVHFIERKMKDGTTALGFDISVPDWSRGQGNGTEAMRRVIAISEETGIPLLGYPSAFGGGAGPDTEGLFRWYESLGLTRDGNSVVYVPNRPVSSARKTVVAIKSSTDRLAALAVEKFGGKVIGVDKDGIKFPDLSTSVDLYPGSTPDGKMAIGFDLSASVLNPSGEKATIRRMKELADELHITLVSKPVRAGDEPRDAARVYESWESAGFTRVGDSLVYTPPAAPVTRTDNLISPVVGAATAGEMPSPGTAWEMNRDGYRDMLENLWGDVAKRLDKKKRVFTRKRPVAGGNVTTTTVSAATGGARPVAADSVEGYQMLLKAADRIQNRVDDARLTALKYAEHWRDFTMHMYGDKRYFDLGLSYLLPYHYWYTRTYYNWMRRLATNPGVVAAYAKYREAIEQSNADSPEYWKHSLRADNLLGIQLPEPLFLQLEQTIWPLYGLTGTDFDDPYKRVNWLSATIDDMGKFGPSVWAPINLALAAGLYDQGEEDAAARWGGRLIPQTAMIKSLLAKLPIDMSTIPWEGEFDPFVNIFSGGTDPYERAQIGRYLGTMVDTEWNGQVVTREMAIDAAHSASGPLWSYARQQALGERAPGRVSSFLLGVGMRPRTQEDLRIDAFYAEYRQLRTLWDTLAPEERRRGMDELRVKYPFMDTVLISRRGGIERDLAFSYNVLSRLPPGQSSALLQAVGLSEGIVDKFYEAKSPVPFEGWTTGDIDRWRAGMVDLAVMLELPDNATAAEWNEARTKYKAFLTDSENMFGSNIWQSVSDYYSLYDTDRQAAEQLMQSNPRIQQAIMARQEFKIKNPIVYKYYGSVDTVYSYYNGWMYQQLHNEFPNIQAEWDRYYARKLIYPNLRTPQILRRYNARKAELQEIANEEAIRIATLLPERPQFNLRQDFTSEASPYRAAAQAATEQEQLPTWRDWQGVLSPSLQNMVVSHIQNGVPLSDVARNQLLYNAEKLGIYNVNEAIRAIGIVISQNP